VRHDTPTAGQVEVCYSKHIVGCLSGAPPQQTQGAANCGEHRQAAGAKSGLRARTTNRRRLARQKETRMRLRLGIYLAVTGLVVPALASAQQFHPSMVEVGEVSPQEPRVTFDPPFPSTPKVILSIKDQNVGGTYRGCGVEAKNITATGFDYFPACSARRPGGPLPVPLNLIAIWIASLQQ
jgi:hypothetical protein